MVKKLLLIGILLMGFLVALTGCGGGNGSAGPVVVNVTTIAGLAGSSGTTDGIGTAARFFQPGGIAVDSNGNLYVADTYNHTIRKLIKDGSAYTVSTIAGTAGSFGSTDGDGLTQAKFNYPESIAVDGSGNLYVADTSNSSVRKLTWSGSAYTVTTLDSSFAYPRGVAVDSSGNTIYVADTNNATIRMLTKSGSAYTVSTIAGSAGSTGTTDGDGLTVARFSYPCGITVDGDSNLYVTDANKHTIRKLIKNGTTYTVTTIAGSAGLSGSTDGDGLSEAKFSTPRGIAVNNSGNLLYVADTNNNIIRKLTKNGTAYTVTTIAGLANNSGSTDGIGTLARFSGPYGITINGNGNLFVVELVNHTIRMITSN